MSLTMGIIIWVAVLALPVIFAIKFARRAYGFTRATLQSGLLSAFIILLMTILASGLTVGRWLVTDDVWTVIFLIFAVTACIVFSAVTVAIVKAQQST